MTQACFFWTVGRCSETFGGSGARCQVHQGNFDQSINDGMMDSSVVGFDPLKAMRYVVVFSWMILKP